MGPKDGTLAIRLHSILDIFITIASFIWAYIIKKYLLPEFILGLPETPNHYVVILLIIILWFILFEAFGFYKSFQEQAFLTIFLNVVKATTTGITIIIFLLFVLKLQDISRFFLGIFYLNNIALLTASKWVIYKKYTKDPTSESKFYNILVVGSRERALDVICAIQGSDSDSKNECARAQINGRKIPGYRVIGCIDVDKQEVGRYVSNDCKVIGTLDDLDRILLDEPVDELFLAMPLNLIQQIDKHIAFAGKIGVPIRIIPDWQIKDLIKNFTVSYIEFEVFSGLATIILSAVPKSREALLIKSGIDYIFSALFLLILLPLFVLASLAIKVSSRGPIFFKQSRIGRNGRIFSVYKFRTMVADAEKRQKELEAFNEAEGPVFKMKNDPRIIPFVGTFLRRTFIDELPQMINVLKGEMSLIGPRPLPLAEQKKSKIWQFRRLSMKPGMTCLWQVNPKRHDMSFDEWMRLDLYYIDNWSLALDAKIFLNTLKVVILGSGR